MRGRQAAPAAGSNDVNGAARWAVGAVLPLAMANLACQRQPRPPEIRSAADLPAAMAWALGETRRFEPSIGPGEAGSHCAALSVPDDDDAHFVPFCSPPPRPDTDAFERLSVLAPKVRRLLSAAPGVDARRARAHWALIWSDEATEIERAIEWLERSSAEEPGRAELLADLGGAYYLRAGVAGDPADLLRALDASIRAAEVQQSAPGADWNRSLALSRLGLADGVLESGLRATEDWEQHRASSPRVRCPEIDAERAVEAGFAQQLRELGEQVVLGAWGEAVLAARPEVAASCLGVASRIGETVARHRGERLLARAVEQIETVDARTRSALAAGYAEFALGVQAVRSHRFAEGRAGLAKAAEDLGATRSPLVAWAVVYGALADRYTNRANRALAAMRAELRTLESIEGARSLEARVLWLISLIEDDRGSTQAALASMERARRLLHEVDEREDAGAIEIHARDLLGDMGRDLEANRALRRATLSLRFATNPWRRHNVLHWLAEACHLEGLVRAERLFLEALSDSAARLGSSLSVVQVERLRALAAIDRAEELEHLERALELVGGITDAGVREPVAATIYEDLAKAHLRIDPAAAETFATRSASLFESNGSAVGALRVRLIRAEARARAGSISAARSDLVAIYREIERRRSRMLQPSERAELLEAAAGATSGVVEALAAARVQPEEIWSVLAEQRAWNRLGVATTASSGRSISLAELEASLPPSAAILEFAVTEAETLSWLVRSGGTVFERVTIGRSELQHRVDALRTAIVRRDPEAQDMADELSKVMLPGLAGVEGIRRLVIVPDGPLFDAPFGIFREPERRERLSERYVLSFALVSASSPGEASAPTGGSRIDALFVANPIVAGEFEGRFPRLPGSEREARSSAVAYARSEIVIGESATFEALRDRLSAHPAVVQISTHSILASGRKRATGLLFAPSPSKPDGVVWEEDLEAVSFAGTKVVLFAGCRTSGTRRTAADGAPRLARAVLNRGAGRVMVTLWDVDDEIVARLLEAVHAELATGTAIESALASLIAVQVGAGSSLLLVPELLGLQVLSRSAVDVLVGIDDIDTVKAHSARFGSGPEREWR